MSLASTTLRRSTSCFPRVSGDEPGVFARFLQLETFSPRERG